MMRRTLANVSSWAKCIAVLQVADLTRCLLVLESSESLTSQKTSKEEAALFKHSPGNSFYYPSSFIDSPQEIVCLNLAETPQFLYLNND